MTTEATAVKRRAPRKSSFDNAERERLRATLVGYMEQHRIGVPTLQVRIADASDRSPQLIPLKTLQRFLAAAGRTNDAFLVPCFEFAKSLPITQTADDIAGAFGAFFGMDGAGAAGAIKGVPDRLSGSYQVSVQEKPASGLRLLEGGKRSSWSQNSHCTVSSENPAAGLVREEFPGEVRQLYEGVLLFFDPLVFVLLKNKLTRLPRAYWLREVGAGEMMGSGMEALFLTDTNVARPYTKPVDFWFRRDSSQEVQG